MPRRSPQTERLVEVIELLSAPGAPQHTLSQLARYLGLDKATCYPMLSELVRVGWLIRHPARKTYHLGPRLIAIGHAASGSVDVIDFARPVLARLADEAGRVAAVIVRSENDLLAGDVVPPRSVRVDKVGLRPGDLVAFSPPLGSSLIAWDPPDEVDRWLDRQAPAARSAGNRAHYLAVLDAVREREFMMEEFPPNPHGLRDIFRDITESTHGHARAERLVAQQVKVLYPEVAVGALVPDRMYWPISVNAPVFDPNSRAIAAICLLHFPDAMSGAQLTAIGAQVREAAREVTRSTAGIWPG